MTPQTDIVLPVRDALDYTKKCIDSIFQHTQNFRLILVDDNSQEMDTTAYLMSVLLRQPIALYTRTGQQKWWTRAVNIGMRLARTARVVIINSDCVVDAGWLEEMYAVWDLGVGSSLKVGLVGSTFSTEEPRRWADIRPPGYVTGHCLLVAMDAIAEVANLRGNPGWYFNEVERGAAHIESDKIMSWELNRLGYATVASFKAQVGHYGGRSWNYDLGKVAQIRLGDPLKGEILG